MFDWSLNMKRSLLHGRASQRGKTLAEAEDYSHVKRNVNGYFVSMDCGGLTPLCYRQSFIEAKTAFSVLLSDPRISASAVSSRLLPSISAYSY
jgi:hypothetical protein